MKPNDSEIARKVKELVPAKRVALIHDWLTGMRGGEKVLEELCLMFPEADIFTLIHTPDRISEGIEKHRIIESPIVRLPFGRRFFRTYLPLFPWAMESFDLKGYDLIISSSHSVAKGVIPTPDALHVTYAHTPMRYVWDVRSDYLGPQQLSQPLRAAAGLVAHYLRIWDEVSAARVDRFAANSGHIRDRIRKYYRREATVIYPPVAIDHFSLEHKASGYFLVVSALVPYKRVDLAVEACSRLGLRLIVVGEGSEDRKLARLAGGSVEFVGSVSLEKIIELYQGADALIHAGEEDFGIVLVEAQACGCPVIAYGRGGALETVISDGAERTGVFFHEQSVASLMELLRGFDPDQFDAEAIRRNAERFNRDRFLNEMTEFIHNAWEDNREHAGRFV